MSRIALWLAQHQLKSKTPARRLRALQRLRTALNDAVIALDDKITIALLDHTLAEAFHEVSAVSTTWEVNTRARRGVARNSQRR